VEYRIEDLARTTGVALDTIRFYQGKGLLLSPRRQGRVTWYSDAHRERLARIKSLQQRGFTLAVIRRFLDGELESSDEALVEAITQPSVPETLTLEELAVRSGVAVPLLRSLEQAGLLVAVQGVDPPRYSTGELETLAAGMKLLEAGVPIGPLIELGREYDEAVDRLTRRAVELFDRHVRERIQAEGRDAEVAEQELLALFNRLFDASSTLVQHHFRRKLVRAAREHVERGR
jgi:DNA-binding transcriptional MerR regulator